MKELPHNRTFTFPLVLLFLVFAVVPVFYMKSLMDSSLHSRFVLLSVLGLVFFAITKIKLRWTWLDLLIVLSYLWTALSIAWARNFAEALFHTQKSFLVLVVFLWLRHVLLSYSEGESILYKAVLVANIIVLSVAYIQLIKLPELNLVRVYEVVGLNSHKNLLASFLFLSLPFLAIGAMRPQDRALRYAFLTTLFFSVSMLLILQTRAVYVALAVLALASFWIFKKSIGLLKYAGICLLVLGFVALVYVSKPHEVPFQQAGELQIRSESTTERLELWYKTLNLVDAHVLKGVGVGNWQIEFPAVGLEGLKRSQLENVTFQRPHNDFLWVWAETGSVGLLLMLAVYALVFFNGFNTLYSSKVSDATRQELGVLLAALLGFGLISFFDFPRERIEHLLLGTALLALIHHKSETKGYLPEMSLSFGQIPRLAVVALLVLNVVMGLQRIKGEKAAFQAYIYRAQGDWHNLVYHSEQAKSVFYSVDPTSIPLDWYKGVGNFSLGNIDLAVADFENAYRYNPYNFHVLNNLASAYERLGKHELAKSYYQKAIAINPAFDEAKLNLTAVYYNEHKFDKALSLAQSCAQESDRKKQYLKLIQHKILNN